MGLDAILPAAFRPPMVRSLLAALLLTTGLSASALAQQAGGPSSATAPRSLLPDDLDVPPPRVVQPTPLPALETPPLAAPPPAGAPAGAVSAEEAAPETAASPFGEEPAAAAAAPPADPLADLEGPAAEPERAGILTPASGGYAADLFAGSDGRFLAALLDRIEAPLASRWMQILLQRALLTRADAPAGLPAADWVAARARALQAMGAAGDAHRLLSSIATGRYSNRLYGAALRAALASADPVALCPLSSLARARNISPTWELVDAMCMAILGDDISSTALFDSIRRRNQIAAFDIGLAERVASTTGSARRGANPEWGEVGQLTAWRIGLATAASFEIPGELLQAATPAQRGWLVRLANLPVADRRDAAAVAAAIGALSSTEVNRLLAAAAEAGDPAQVNRSPAGFIRRASVAPQMSERIAALRQLWSEGDDGSLERYGWQVAGAQAASRLPADSGLAGDAPAIAASLMAAGITGPAAGWWNATASAAAQPRADLWAQLVAVSGVVPADGGLFDRWAGRVPAHRANLLAAGLQGLGRGDVGGTVERLDNLWTRALDRAVAAGHGGEVLLLAATAFRGHWAEVPPDYLRRIAAALVATGHEAEARLLVAEAANRG